MFVHLTNEFIIQNGPKKGDALHAIAIALTFAITKVQETAQELLKT
jgi:hypothetical protein